MRTKLWRKLERMVVEKDMMFAQRQSEPRKQTLSAVLVVLVTERDGQRSTYGEETKEVAR